MTAPAGRRRSGRGDALDAAPRRRHEGGVPSMPRLSRVSAVRPVGRAFHAPLLALAAAVAASAGCSSATDEGATATDAGLASDATSAGCADDPRVGAYTDGLHVEGLAAKAALTIEHASPAPPERGTNAWSVRLTDAAGAPIDGAALTVKPYMPDHAHGSSVVPSVAPTGEPGGYAISGLELFMPGVWQITISIAVQGVEFDVVRLTFCVRG